MLPKDKIIIFEGIDKVGKSTVRKELLKRCPNQVTIDRLHISNWVYSDFYKRDENFFFLNEIDHLLKDSSIVVYIHDSYDRYKERCDRVNHESLSQDEFNLQHELFLTHLESSSIKEKIILDGRNKTIEQLTEELIEKL